MKFFKKKPLLSLIIGLIILAIGISGIAFELNVSGVYGVIFKIVLALLLLAVGWFIVVPDFKNTNHKGLKTLFGIEVALVVLGATFGFIVPLFQNEPGKIADANLWFGLILFAHGSINLFAGTHQIKTVKGFKFLFNWLFLILGLTIYLRGLVLQYLQMITAISLIVVGLIFIIIAMKHKKK